MRSSSSGSHVLDLPSAGSNSSSCDEDLHEFSSQSDLDSLTFDSAEGPTQLEHTFARLQEAELMRNGFLSLTQRVELNRNILQHLLRSPPGLDQSESRVESNTGSDLDVSDSEDLQNGNKHRPFVSAPLPRQQQCKDGARMKRRPEPLRADHNLVTPDTRSLLGVRFSAVTQLNSLPGHLNDPSSSQTASRSTRRRPASSPNRRLRFEDETEKEAESRYLERQKRRAGQRMQDILVSKPDVSQYVNGRPKVGLVDAQHIPGLGGGVNLQLHPMVHNQRQSLYLISPSRPYINLRTEPIKETYIGLVTHSDSDGRESAQVEERTASNMRVRRRANHMEHNGFNKPAMPSSDLPINPYAPDQIVVPSSSRVSATAPTKVPSPPVLTPPPPTSISVNGKPSDTRKDKKQNQKKTKAKNKKCQNSDQNVAQKEQGALVADVAQSQLQIPGNLGEGTACVGESGVDSKIKPSFSSGVETETPPASKSNGDLRGKQPMRAEHHSIDSGLVAQVEGSRLSLRRLFSSVRLGRSRTSSLDRASSRSCPSAPDPSGALTGQTKPYGLLKKTPSFQSLTMGSPFLKLRKSASVQSFVSEQKKDRSENYKPAAQSALQRCLSVEDVSCPSSLRSVGRILQVCSDGTLLLELSRPKNQMYGFIISRGRGRPDSGVYVEDMVDNSTEKLYAGLLAVGDEILEVNEEKVACFNLDQVTQMLTQSSTVRVRVLRQRKPTSR